MYANLACINIRLNGLLYTTLKLLLYFQMLTSCDMWLYYIEINTSNRVFYELSSINAAIGSSSGQNYFCFTGSVTADMDASDTCNLRVVMGGTSGAGPSDISTNSHFSGHLVC